MPHWTSGLVLTSVWILCRPDPNSNNDDNGCCYEGKPENPPAAILLTTHLQLTVKYCSSSAGTMQCNAATFAALQTLPGKKKENIDGLINVEEEYSKQEKMEYT